MEDDVAINKAAIIERCLRRVAEEYAGDPARLMNITHQDAIILNLERACQAAIDLAMHAVAKDRLGVPQASRISGALAAKLRAMVGFWNIAIHQYQALDVTVLRHVIESAHGDLVEFCRALGLRIGVPS